MSLIVQPRSLLIFTGDTYSEMYHSIESKSIDDIYANEKGVWTDVDEDRLSPVLNYVP